MPARLQPRTTATADVLTSVRPTAASMARCRAGSTRRSATAGTTCNALTETSGAIRSAQSDESEGEYARSSTLPDSWSPSTSSKMLRPRRVRGAGRSGPGVRRTGLLPLRPVYVHEHGVICQSTLP